MTVELLFPYISNEKLDGKWWLDPATEEPENRPSIHNLYDNTVYYHLNLTLHEWLVEQNISYDVFNKFNAGLLSFGIRFPNSKDAMLFKLIWM